MRACCTSTVAGVILAGTFAALARQPVVDLTQVGTAIALGVLLDTLLVRTVLVPAAFLTLRETAFRDPKSYFHRYSKLDDKQAVETATSIWQRINLLNLRENILPTRQRAHLILKKAANHLVQEVALRKL